MVDAENFYSELGKTFEPGIITRVVLAAMNMAKQGKKIIGFTGGMYDPPSLPGEEVSEILAEASEEDWKTML